MAERDLVVRIIGDEKDLIRALQSSARGTKQFETQMARTSRSIRNVFAAAGIGLGAAGIIRALRSTVGAALSFESSFAGVRKTVNATEPQLQALAQSFRRLALEIPVSVDEINRIGEAAGQLGIQRTGILDFTKTVAALGATTNLASDQAADALARLANITQTPQDQFDNLGSTIADLGNKLAATESEIVDFGLRIAASGKIVGLTVDQTLAIAGAFSSVGVEAEAGGTAVSKVFISLANAVQTGGKQLETFAKTAGVSAAEFQRAFEQDAGGAFVSFVQGLARIDKEGGNVFKTLKSLGLTDARLIRAFLSISQSGDLLNRSLEVGSRAWQQNSALQIEAAKRYETTASKLQIFQNRVNDLQITLGNVLAPALLDIVTPLGEWLEQTKNQERVQRALIDTMKDARAVFDGVRAVVQPLAEATKSLADRMGGLKRAVELLLVAMVASKIVGFGLAITGLGSQALVATGRVNALRFALLRLGAIGVIALGVEIILNADEIDKAVRGPGGLLDKIHAGFLKGGGKLEIPVGINAAQLQRARDELAAVKGEGDLAVKALDKAISRLTQAGRTGATGSREDATRGITKAAVAALAKSHKDLIGETEKAEKVKKKLVAAFEKLMDRLGLDLDKAAAAKDFADDLRVLQAQERAVRAEIQVEGRTVALERRLFEIEQERLRIAEEQAALVKERLRKQREAARVARISSQFKAIGLTAEGEQRVPGVGALRGRLTSLREQLKGTVLDTDKTRSRLAAIAKVLSGEFGKVGKDVRSAILQMFNDIASALERKEGPLTKTRKVNINALLENMGLSEDELRELRSRLSQITSGGGRRGLAPAGATSGTNGRPGRESGGVFVVHTHVHLDGKEIANSTTRHQQRNGRRHAGSRGGTRPGER